MGVSPADYRSAGAQFSCKVLFHSLCCRHECIYVDITWELPVYLHVLSYVLTARLAKTVSFCVHNIQMGCRLQIEPHDNLC